MRNKNIEYYNQKFYQDQAKQSYESAINVLSLFKDKILMPDSVIDLGAGVGTWLRAWQDLGVSEIYGIDGNNIPDEFLYVSRTKLEIQDLNSILPTNHNKKYDLAMSLEVAEHLNPNASENFVHVLTSYSDIILFSAALPLQYGTNHINCRPLKFWVDLFYKYGFVCFDAIRPELLTTDKKVAPWYMQNILLFVKQGKISDDFSRKFTQTQNPVQFYHNDTITTFQAKEIWPFVRTALKFPLFESVRERLKNLLRGL